MPLKALLQTRKPGQRQLDMFEREKQISLALRHPHIVHCERAGCWNEVHFIEMEYMDGGCLWGLLQQRGKLPLSEAAPIMLQALEGLAYAHGAELELPLREGVKTVRGVVHRDLKTPNILLTGAPGRWTAKVGDFGLAKAFSQAGMTKGGITAPGMILGSRSNMAPEHLMNYRYIEPCTDVFEMAASFYEMLTGKLVWDFRPNVDPLRVILEDTPKPIRSQQPDVPEPVAAVLDQALSRDRTARYPDAGAFLAALKNAL